MAQAAPRARRRGEAGFAAEQRARGGDPRLRSVPEPAPRPEPAAAPPDRAEGRGRIRRAAGTTARPERLASTPFRPGGRLTVNDASGFLLGVFVWVLVLQFLRDGPQGVRDWLRAKFLNRDPSGKELP